MSQFAVYGLKNDSVSTLASWGELGKISALQKAIESNSSGYYDYVVVEWRWENQNEWGTLVRLIPSDT